MQMPSRVTLGEMEQRARTIPTTDTIEKLTLSPFPYFDNRASATQLGVALVGVTASGVSTLVILRLDAAGDELYSWHCVDPYVEARLGSDKRLERVEAARAQASAVKAADVEAELDALYGFNEHTPSGQCDFFKQWRLDKSHVCHHHAALLEAFNAQHPGTSLEQALRDKLNEFISGGSAAAARDVDVFRAVAFKYPILIVGESGSGKTRGAEQFSKEIGAKLVKLSCEPGTTAAEITGYTMRAPSGDYVWVDGKVTEAYRLALKGQKVLLLVDEMLRADPRELSIFLSAFERSSLTGKYHLQTGRILSAEDGVAVLETLVVDPANVCIVATTNIGGKYAVNNPDKALGDRFFRIRLDNTLEGVVDAAENECKTKSFPLSVASSCGVFWQAMRNALKQGTVSDTPSKRTLNRAIELARTPSEVPFFLEKMTEHWVEVTMEGEPNPDQTALVKTAIAKAFGLEPTEGASD